MSVLKTVAQLKLLFESGDIPSEIDFADLIEKASVHNGKAIFTTAGRYYDLSGLTVEERGLQLHQAIDEVGGDTWIFIPPGEYYTATGYIWRDRDSGIIGMGGSSKNTLLWSDLAHCFTMDTSHALYNSVHKNFSVATHGEGNEIDAINFRGVDGVSISQSTLDMNLHISDSDRDGIHFEGKVISGRFHFKTTGQAVLTSVDRYMVYAEEGSGFNIQLDDNQRTIIYLGANTNGIAINMTVIEGSDTNKIKVFDYGTNNIVKTGSDVNSFLRNGLIEGVTIQSPVLEIPSSKIVAYYPFDSINSNKFLDHSNNQNDATLSGGVSIINSDFGNLVTFDGINGMGTIQSNTALQSISDKIIISMLIEVNEDIQSRVMYGSDFEIEYEAGGTIYFKVTINGVKRNRGISGIDLNKLYLFTYTYDGQGYNFRKNQVGGDNTVLVGGIVQIGSSNIDIAKISTNYFACKISSMYILNDCTPELIKAVESKILLNSNNLNNVKKREGDNKYYGDNSFEDSSKGIILIDRSTTSKYRIKIDGGVLGIELI